MTRCGGRPERSWEKMGKSRSLCYHPYEDFFFSHLSGHVSAARWPYDPEKEAAGFTRRREESQDVDISSEP